LFNKFFALKTMYFTIQNKKHIDNIYTYSVNKQDNNYIVTEKNSKHYWNESINDEIKDNIQIINSEILSHLTNMEYVPSMTELYYSSKGNNNSDKQYVSTHMDGPFFTCKSYRALIIINGNKNIDTYFPDENLKINLKKYDVLLFDYNNTPHYININNNTVDESQRIILKLHYISRDSSICKSNHCKFGRQTRDLFELNKNKLYLSGILSRTGLYYNTFRLYIVLIVLLLIIYYLFYRNQIVKFLLCFFVLIETFFMIYTLHFIFLYRKECIYKKNK